MQKISFSSHPKTRVGSLRPLGIAQPFDGNQRFCNIIQHHLTSFNRVTKEVEHVVNIAEVKTEWKCWFHLSCTKA